MASIQQSLNQLLGAVAGATTMGSYMYRQTPGYQEKKELELLDRKTNKLYNAMEETAYQSGGEEGTPEWEALRNLEEEDIKTKRRALEIDPTEERAKEYSRAMKEYALDFPNKKADAEQAGLDRVAQSTETQLTQRQALKERFDFLKAFSAKERGQFETAYNRHKNKGEID